MPLRALVDGREVLAPLMPPGEWYALRSSRREHSVILACCGAEGLLRTSHLGNQHFYHRHSGTCTWPPESTYHLLAKLQIALACEQAGWQPSTEWSEAGWRADVLASRKGQKGREEASAGLQVALPTRRRFRRHPLAINRPVPELRIAPGRLRHGVAGSSHPVLGDRKIQGGAGPGCGLLPGGVPLVPPVVQAVHRLRVHLPMRDAHAGRGHGAAPTGGRGRSSK